MIKVSDYIAQFLVENGIKNLFLISGGGIMHMLDSVSRNKDLNLIYNLNEQATSMCADAAAQVTGKLAAFMVTSGPGATNAISGVTASWLDGNPVLALSGQCKIADMGQLRGLRQFGAQEVPIIPMVKPITKYAATVMKKEDVRYELEKAAYIAMHGRRGPTWLEVPLDIQGSIVEEADLRPFKEEDWDEPAPMTTPEAVQNVIGLLNRAKRPVILAGQGIVAANCKMALRELSEEFNIPVLTTWRAKGIFGDEEALYMGSPGIPTTRFSNYVLQNADFLLIIGTRLNPALTAYDEANFAPNAKKVIVDIEENEIKKLTMPFEQTIVSDAGSFMGILMAEKHYINRPDRKEWLDFCTAMKKKYPLTKEKQPLNMGTAVDGYQIAKKISDCSSAEDVFIGSASGRSCPISHMAYNLKPLQPFVTSMGLGSMGFALPQAVGGCVASGKKRTIVIEGDGSLQHNIQELQLISTYHLPIKIFVLSNNGYAQIYLMQKNNFKSNFTGCQPENGLCFPKLEDVAKSYGLPYWKIGSQAEMSETVEKIMADNEPAIVDVVSSIEFDEIPKSLTVANKDGTFTSSRLENLFPFLPEEEVAENMPQWKD